MCNDFDFGDEIKFKSFEYYFVNAFTCLDNLTNWSDI